MGVVLVLAPLMASAQPPNTDSTGYLYLQGDKELPFYAMLDGKMCERYGLNHVTVSGISGGNHELVVSFRRNEMPPEKFSVEMLAGYHRAFLLVLKDRIYKLYDLEAKTYIDPER